MIIKILILCIWYAKNSFTPTHSIAKCHYALYHRLNNHLQSIVKIVLILIC